MTPADACAACPGLCVVCALDAVEWPPRAQSDIAAAEARGLAFAGAGTPRPASVAAVWDRHRQARARARNRHRYGPGGLFDTLQPESDTP